jgi:hypothetical protein
MKFQYGQSSEYRAGEESHGQISNVFSLSSRSLLFLPSPKFIKPTVSLPAAAKAVEASVVHLHGGELDAAVDGANEPERK